jgi:geranylgeranyl transferase type-1 subunit beta
MSWRPTRSVNLNEQRLLTSSDCQLDIYHSYLGLAALATMQEPVLKDFDPVLCVSKQARMNLDRMRKQALSPKNAYQNHGYFFHVREDDSNLADKLASSLEG